MGRQTLGKPTGASYSAGVVVPDGRLVFISGTVAMTDNGDVIAPEDMEAQSRHIFARISELLAEAGAGLDNIVKITTFVTDMSKYTGFAKVRGEIFGSDYPASATVGVSALVKPELLIEVEAIAVV